MHFDTRTGFFLPSVYADYGSRDVFQRALVKPFRGISSIPEFLSRSAPVPCLGVFTQAVRDGRAKLIPMTNSNSAQFILNDRFAGVTVPPNRWLGAYLEDFGRALGRWHESQVSATPGDGWSFPFSRDSFTRKAERLAIGLSYYLQFTHEMESLGIRLARNAQRHALLTETDLAAYRVLNECGLPGLIQFLREEDVMPMSPASMTGIGTTTSLICGSTYLNRLVNDQVARDRSILGLLPSYPSERISDNVTPFHPFVQAPVKNKTDLAYLIDGIFEIAPHMAHTLFPEDVEAWLSEKVMMAKDQVLPVVLAVDTLFGPEETAAGQGLDIHFNVRRETPGGVLLRFLVPLLAQLKMPKELTDGIANIQLPGEMSHAKLTEYYMTCWAVRETWGEVAWMRFWDECKGNRFELNQYPVRPSFRAAYSRYGFSVLCEHWREFLSEDAIQDMQSRMEQLAKRKLMRGY